MATVFAVKAEIGKKYLTSKGWPVEVKSIGKDVELKNLITNGSIVRVTADTLLRPYKESEVSKEAKEFDRYEKASRGKSRAGAKPHIARLTKALARVGDRRVVHKEYKGKKITLEVKEDGFYVGSKRYPSLTKAAQGATGTKITTGPAFWGFPIR